MHGRRCGNSCARLGWDAGTAWCAELCYSEVGQMLEQRGKTSCAKRGQNAGLSGCQQLCNSGVRCSGGCERYERWGQLGQSCKKGAGCKNNGLICTVLQWGAGGKSCTHSRRCSTPLRSCPSPASVSCRLRCPQISSVSSAQA